MKSHDLWLKRNHITVEVKKAVSQASLDNLKKPVKKVAKKKG